MQWIKIEPVQQVGALLVVGEGSGAWLVGEILRRAAPFHALEVAQGPAWAAIFAMPLADETGATGMILPRIQGSRPLYLATGGWWLPIGVGLDAPEHAHDQLWTRLADLGPVSSPAIVVPRFDVNADLASAADVYLISSRRSVGDLAS